MSTRTRFAPSPTGYLHIGSVRTALYCWLFARHSRGDYLVRIEDTDRQRSTQAAIDAVHESLAWLGLEGDEPPIYQTARFDRYRERLDEMLAQGKAYHCYCTPAEIDAMRAEAQAKGEKPRYDGRCRTRTELRPGIDPVVRFRNPADGKIIVDDQIKGEVVFDNSELDDLIIARSDGRRSAGRAGLGQDRARLAFPGGRGRFTCRREEESGRFRRQGDLDWPSSEGIQPAPPRVGVELEMAGWRFRNAALAIAAGAGRPRGQPEKRNRHRRQSIVTGLLVSSGKKSLWRLTSPGKWVRMIAAAVGNSR